nr:MAG TPA: hypothetical protein [Caudoviricetes sp.]
MFEMDFRMRQTYIQNPFHQTSREVKYGLR